MKTRPKLNEQIHNQKNQSFVIENKTLSIEAYIINTKGTEMITDKIEGYKTDAITTGELLAKKLIKKGAKKLLEL